MVNSLVEILKSPESGSQQSILIVDDKPFHQATIAIILNRLGYLTNVASDGFEALSILQCDEIYDIVLVGCEMSLMNGYHVTRYIRDWEMRTGRHHTTIIGIGDISCSELCFQAGMDDYLDEPLNSLILKAVLGHWRRKKIGSADSRQRVAN